MSDASRYHAEIDLFHPNDPRVAAIGRVPAGARVLDLGMANGSVARVLTGMGCRVTGIDIDEDAIAAASDAVEEAIVADLSAVDLPGLLAGREFDVVLALDVLEHLPDPVRLLRSLAGILAEGGWAVISLPNVAHVSVRMDLLQGRFTYRDTGLLDRTHLRFFDRDGVDALVEEAGWTVLETVRVTRRYGETEIEADPLAVPTALELEDDPDARTYQFVVTAVPAGSALVDRPPVLPAAAAQSRLLEAISYIDHLEHEIGKLKRAMPPNLAGELEEIRIGSLNRRASLRDLLVAVQENTERMSRYA